MENIILYGTISCWIEDKNDDFMENPLPDKYANKYDFTELNCSLTDLNNFLKNEENNEVVKKFLTEGHNLNINFEIRTVYKDKRGFAKPYWTILDIKTFEEAFYYLPEFKNHFDFVKNSPILR